MKKMVEQEPQLVSPKIQEILKAHRARLPKGNEGNWIDAEALLLFANDKENMKLEALGPDDLRDRIALLEQLLS